MKRLLYCITTILLTSCAYQKHAVTAGSADAVNVNAGDLGWAKRLMTDYQIKENVMPYVFRSANDGYFSVELPCWDEDSEMYYTANVITEHPQLDSALILAKQQGIDLISYAKTSDEINTRKADLSCVCIVKNKTSYIINATVRIPK